MGKKSPTSILATHAIPIEKFLEMRAAQSESQAKMFQRFNKLDDWHGRQYTEKDIENAKLDAEKCLEALKFLQNKYKQ